MFYLDIRPPFALSLLLGLIENWGVVQKIDSMKFPQYRAFLFR